MNDYKIIFAPRESDLKIKFAPRENTLKFIFNREVAKYQTRFKGNSQLFYIGIAIKGSSETAAVWKVTKIEVALQGTVTTTVEYNKKWSEI